MPSQPRPCLVLPPSPIPSPPPPSPKNRVPRPPCNQLPASKASGAAAPSRRPVVAPLRRVRRLAEQLPSRLPKAPLLRTAAAPSHRRRSVEPPPPVRGVEDGENALAAWMGGGVTRSSVKCAFVSWFFFDRRNTRVVEACCCAGFLALILLWGRRGSSVLVRLYFGGRGIVKGKHGLQGNVVLFAPAVLCREGVRFAFLRAALLCRGMQSVLQACLNFKGGGDYRLQCAIAEVRWVSE